MRRLSLNTGREDVFVGVASIPSREASLRTVVERLLPQARQIGVYLNGYDRVPEFLRHDRIVVARSQSHGDLRDNGKFFFLEESGARYYATVDDDIRYPDDYLRQLLETLTEAGQRAAIGVHGAIYPTPLIDLIRSRQLFHFEDYLPHVMPVHLLGTGTALIDQSDWELQFSEFGTPGMADVWFATAASRRDASLFVARRDRGWLEPIQKRKARAALFHQALLDSSEQLMELNTAAVSAGAVEGLVQSLLSSPKFAEDFSIVQAITLDEIRTKLGWAPIAEQVAGRIIEGLESRRGSWSMDHPMTNDEVQAYCQAIADVLMDRVSADTVEAVLDLLSRLRELAAADPREWNGLPRAIRLDSRENRLEQLRVALIERGINKSPAHASRLWSAFRDLSEASANVAIQVERSSVCTQFERLPAIADRAAKNPSSAALLLYEYFEAHGWSRQPDITALRLAFGPAYESLDLQLLICMASLRSGNRDLASRIVSKLRRRWPWDVDVRLMEASVATQSPATTREAVLPILEVLGEAASPHGLAPFRNLLHKDGTEERWIDLLGPARPPEAPSLEGTAPTVSVLMTSYNDESTIAAAITSILSSEGVDLQLVVVDDASTDGTLEAVASIADSRVTIVRNDENVGPYVSRNRGLAHATGEFIAIADADDWSHPQRLAFQASILADFPYAQACKVAHVRIQPNGQIDLENHLRFVGDGPMSLMFRHLLIDHIGGFDHIRTRGDIEFLRRINARFGHDALVSLGIPLVLSTSTRRSNSKLFSKASLDQYRAAARQWHELNAYSDNLYVPLAGARAPFLAPHDLVVDSTAR